MSVPDCVDQGLVERWLGDVASVKFARVAVVADQKTPDWWIEWPDGTSFYAELKTLVDEAPSEAAGWAIQPMPDGSTLSRRTDNAPARVARVIKAAHAQLSHFEHPWCAIVLNRDPMVDPQDFVAAFSGVTEYSSADGSYRLAETSARRVALGDTLSLRYEIDLYLWLDVPKRALWGWSASAIGERVGKSFLAGLQDPWQGLAASGQG